MATFKTFTEMAEAIRRRGIVAALAREGRTGVSPAVGTREAAAQRVALEALAVASDSLRNSSDPAVPVADLEYAVLASDELQAVRLRERIVTALEGR